MLALTGTLKLC